MSTPTRFLASHGLHKNSTLHISQGLPRLLYTVVPDVGTGARVLGCRVRTTLSTHHLSIWLRLQLLRGTFGTCRTAALPASLLIPLLGSALTLGLQEVAGAHP